MERLLLLWDEMDDFVGFGRHVVGGAISEVAGATHRAAAQVLGWSAATSAWLSARSTDPS